MVEKQGAASHFDIQDKLYRSTVNSTEQYIPLTRCGAPRLVEHPAVTIPSLIIYMLGKK